MKKIIAAAILSAPLAASAADFTGLNVWVGGNYTDGEAEFLETDTNVRNSVDDNDFGLTIGADYGFALGDNAVVLVGASWADKAYLGSGTTTDSSNNPLYLKTESDQSYMFYVAPGVKVGQSSLLYAKLSYSEAEGKLTVNIPALSYADSVSQDDKAFGYGVGFRSYVTDNVFLNAEVERIEYDYELPASWALSVETPISRASLNIGMTF